MSSLKDTLEHLKKKERLSLHMPGHKGLRIREDTTELSYTDNLLNPKGSILELEKAITNIYGGKKSYLGTNGSTSFLLGSLFLAGKNKQVVMPRGSHLSVYKGLIIGNHKPNYLENEVDSLGLIKPVTNESYLKTLDNMGDIYLFTTPTYEGFLENYTMLKPFLKDKLSIIDSAHGSHLYYIKKDENTWSDLKVISFHKTLGALNQGASLISNMEKDIREEVNFFQSTSPSFPILLSIEDSLREMMKMKIDKKLHNISWLKEEISKISSLEIISNDDPLKLVISSKEINMRELGEFLKEDKGIIFEMENEDYLLGILSFYDSFEGYSYLIKGLKKALNKVKFSDIEKKAKRKIAIPKMKLLPGEAFRRENILVDIKDSIGKVCGGMYLKYPPGIPSIFYGEEISEDIVEDMLENQKDYLEGSTLIEGKISIIK